MSKNVCCSLLMVVLCTATFLLSGRPAQAQSWSPGQPYGGLGQPARRSKGLQYFQRGLALFKAEDYAGAIEAFKMARGYDPKNKHIYHMMALAYTRSGNDREAITNFKTALNWDYNFIDCRNNYGLVLKKTGQRGEAKKEFEECTRINPKYPDAYHHLGEIYREMGDLENAIKNFQSATRLRPDYFEAQRDLGLALFERSQALDIDSSLEKLIEAARLVPDNPMIHYYIGKVYCANAQLDDAETGFRNSLMHDARLAAAHYELGKLRYHRGDLDRCIIEMKAAAQVNPTYTRETNYPAVEPLAIQSYLARAYEHKSEMIPAVEAWKDVAAMTRNNAEILKKIKLMEKNLRRRAKMRPKAREQIIFDPQEVNALVLKGQSLYDDGRLEEARASLQRALSLNPGSFEALQNIGFILESQGDISGALDRYRSALAVNPDYDGAYFNLAYVLEKMGLPADAGDMYQTFHEKAGRYPYDPKHIVAIQQDEARRRAREEVIRKRGY